MAVSKKERDKIARRLIDLPALRRLLIEQAIDDAIRVTPEGAKVVVEIKDTHVVSDQMIGPITFEGLDLREALKPYTKGRGKWKVSVVNLPVKGWRVTLT